MRAYVIQPEYSGDFSRAGELFERQLRLLDLIGGDADLIVLPESADVPAFASCREEFDSAVSKFTDAILSAASAAAVRCGATVFVNATDKTEKNANTTFCFDKSGKLAGKYRKQHLTPGESAGFRKESSGYSFEYEPVTVVEADGLRFAFLTCYDFYFYEYFPVIAKAKPDIIIGCSHQRTDTHRALDLFTSFAAYSCDAYVVRASVSMGEDSPVGGCSAIVAPDGRVLLDMKSRIGTGSAEFDPKVKYLKPAGYNKPLSSHPDYTERGRRPYKYRPAGPGTVKDDDRMPYPRVCAHRGFSSVAPENSMPAFGAAVASGAEEIEFDLWYTKDGEIVSIHDAKLDRVSDGTGKVYEHTFSELMKYDFGIKKSETFAGLRILRFEDILKQFACRCVMNIHVKTHDNFSEYDEGLLRKIVALIERYDCVNYSYLMSGNDTFQLQAGRIAPHIRRCMGAGPKERRWEIVDRAAETGCGRVQLFKPWISPEMIADAHARGIICNVFYADDPEEARRYLDWGVDTILTNDYQRIKNVVDAFKAEKAR